MQKKNIKVLIPYRFFSPVYNFFKEQYKFPEVISKTKQWFDTPNPMLGGISPREMIADGREEKLLEWIHFQLSENKIV